MTARIITVANQKGGCGKTTITMQVGGTLGRRGIKTLIVDADPQGTATRWAASAPDDRIFPATVVSLAAAGRTLHREVQKLMKDYELILVDCPPAIESQAPQSALLVSDLALIPVIPSPPDLWASVGIKQLLDSARTVNEGLEARLVLNQCQKSRTLAKDTMEILENFDIPVAKGFLGSREAYRHSSLFGCTVYDLGPRAALAAMQEVESLVEEVLALVGVSESKRRARRGR